MGKNFSDAEVSVRMDAEYFQPKYDELIEAIKSYPRKNELNFEYTVLNWRVLNTNGDFSSSIIYNIINRSDVPITEIRGERDGFSHQITDFPIEYSLFGESRKSSSIQISRYEL